MRLQLLPSVRHGGDNRTARKYLDFVVDGRSALERIGWAGADLVTPLGWGQRKFQQRVSAELLREAAPSLSSGRTSIYVCPECGDIGCGAITVRISRVGDRILWSDFASEGREAPYKIVADDMDFDPREYRAAIAAVRMREA
jgi:hypothetical protein